VDGQFTLGNRIRRNSNPVPYTQVSVLYKLQIMMNVVTNISMTTFQPLSVAGPARIMDLELQKATTQRQEIGYNFFLEITKLPYYSHKYTEVNKTQSQN
jgi:hypothetical protein